MTTKRELDADSPAAILATDPVKRLDAIIRRHGGKPTTETTSRVVLPTPPGESAKAN